MFCWIKNVWGIRWIGFKVKIIGTRKIIGTYEINKISLPCFDDKIFVQNNGWDGLPLG